MRGSRHVALADHRAPALASGSNWRGADGSRMSAKLVVKGLTHHYPDEYSGEDVHALDGIDIDNPGTVPGRTGKPTAVPRVVGPIRHIEPVQARDVTFLKKHTAKPVKITVPGAFTMAKMALDEHYHDQQALVMAYANALNAELKALDRKSTRLNSSHSQQSRMPSSA